MYQCTLYGVHIDVLMYRLGCSLRVGRLLSSFFSTVLQYSLLRMESISVTALTVAVLPLPLPLTITAVIVAAITVYPGGYRSRLLEPTQLRSLVNYTWVFVEFNCKKEGAC